MSLFLPYGAVSASLALVLYTVVVFLEFKKRAVTPWVLMFLLSAFVFNVLTVVLMYSKESGCSAHSILGYLSLMVISVNTIMTVRFYVKNGRYTKLPLKARLYASFAYLLVMVAYFTGSFVGLFR